MQHSVVYMNVLHYFQCSNIFATWQASSPMRPTTDWRGGAGVQGGLPASKCMAHVCTDWVWSVAVAVQRSIPAICGDQACLRSTAQRQPRHLIIGARKRQTMISYSVTRKAGLCLLMYQSTATPGLAIQFTSFKHAHHRRRPTVPERRIGLLLTRKLHQMRQAEDF